MRKLLIFIIFLAGITSCVYPFDPALEGTSEDILVFEGRIIAGGASTVRVSRVRSFSGDSSPISSGVVWVEDDGGGKYNASEGSTPGQGVTIPTEAAPGDRRYRMVAEVEGRTYSSDWIKPLAPPVLESVEFVPSAIGNDLEVFVTMSGGDESTGYLGIYFDETWEFHSDYMCGYVLDTSNWEIIPRSEPYPNYWCWRSASSTMTILDHSEYDGGRVVSFPIHSFSRSNERNHRRYSINVRAVTLPKETYRYMKNLDDISNGTGTLFSPNPGEMASNVSCESDPSVRVMGYVTASMEASKREFIDDRYYVSTQPPQGYLFVPASKFDYMYYYSNGYYPVNFMVINIDGEDVQDIFWGPMRCIDCVIDGGTKQKPDFWQDE
ncbi:MAG: DUF4249 domain-containing protein [Bacteroidales bacterium]|nr:DUF4249 domain-containing protein [Bacteroidales bacterium]